MSLLTRKHNRQEGGDKHDFRVTHCILAPTLSNTLFGGWAQGRLRKRASGPGLTRLSAHVSGPGQCSPAAAVLRNPAAAMPVDDLQTGLMFPAGDDAEYDRNA